MKSRQYKILTALTSILAVGAIESHVNAQIVLDTFTGADGSLLQGRTPATDLPNSTWQNVYQQLGNDGPATIESNSLITGYNGDGYISIAGSGTYVEPPELTVSMNFAMNTIANDTAAQRGIGLGFFIESPNPGDNASDNFTGLAVTPDGDLYLEINGVASTTSVALTNFSASTAATLSYSINTVTGAITDVSYGGTDYSSTFALATTGPLSSTDVGYWASTAVSVSNHGLVNSFEVTDAPEPSTWAMLLGGLGAMAFVVRRRKNA